MAARRVTQARCRVDAITQSSTSGNAGNDASQHRSVEHCTLAYAANTSLLPRGCLSFTRKCETVCPYSGVLVRDPRSWRTYVRTPRCLRVMTALKHNLTCDVPVHWHEVLGGASSG